MNQLQKQLKFDELVQKITKEVKGYNPYFEELFINPTEEEYKGAGAELQQAGIVPDRIFGKIGRNAWQLCVNTMHAAAYKNYFDKAKTDYKIKASQRYEYQTIVSPYENQYAVQAQDNSSPINLFEGTRQECELWRSINCKPLPNEYIPTTFSYYETTFNEILLSVYEMNPYPADVFTEPTKDEWEGAHRELTRCGINPERIFANWGRTVWNNCVNEFNKWLTE